MRLHVAAAHRRRLSSPLWPRYTFYWLRVGCVFARHTDKETRVEVFGFNYSHILDLLLWLLAWLTVCSLPSWSHSTIKCLPQLERARGQLFKQNKGKRGTYRHTNTHTHTHTLQPLHMWLFSHRPEETPGRTQKRKQWGKTTVNPDFSQTLPRTLFIK